MVYTLRPSAELNAGTIIRLTFCGRAVFLELCSLNYKVYLIMSETCSAKTDKVQPSQI